MSKFFTPIPVDVAAALKLLPQGAFVEAVRYNYRQDQVEIVWDHPPFHTGKDFAVEFGQADLQGRRLPKGVGKQPPRPKDTSVSAKGLPAKSRTSGGKAAAPVPAPAVKPEPE